MMTLHCSSAKVFGLWLALAALAATAPAARPGASIVWIEAERFQHPGGWINDSQFIDQMGSPYLLANGMGTSVADAVTKVDLPQSGPWRVWVRAKDWYPANHPGPFELRIDGKKAGPTLGASGKKGWLWEDAGIHALSGSVELRLHDLTGYYGRCDAIALSADPAWIPPADLDAIAQLREAHGGVSREIKNMGAYDVVVVGGGLAGCMAAVAAARMGVSVALIQNRPVLGGNASTECMVPPVGLATFVRSALFPLDPRETGLLEEIRTLGTQTTPQAKVYTSRLARLVALEPNLSLFLNTHATGVEKSAQDTISTVLAVDVNSGRRERFGGKIFVDCTGDGSVGAAACATWRQGREARSEFGEPHAVERADTHTMGNSLKYYAEPAAGPQPFVTPAWAMKFPDCDSFPKGFHPPNIGPEIEWQWIIELGGMGDAFKDKEENRDDLLRLIYGIWGHLKNNCPRLKAQAAHSRLAWVETVVSVRETRRLIGDYIFTENDILERKLQPDRIGYGAWTVDDHPPQGYFAPPTVKSIEARTAAPVRPARRAGRPANTAIPHSIPFRSLYSKDIGNLMMAGRDASASHRGISAIRVMLTCAVMGQAVGDAAALCIQNKTTPRGLYRDHLERLQQQLLKDGAYIMEMPNRDPRDLARQATVSASSLGRDAQGEPMAAAHVIDGYARAVRTWIGPQEESVVAPHAWAPEAKAAGPHWIELAWNQPVTFNMVHVSFQTKPLAPRHFTLQAWQEGQWVTIDEVRDNAFRRNVRGLTRLTTTRLRVLEEQPAGICEIRVYDEPERLVDIARRADRNMRLPDTDAFYPWETPKRAR